jgi:hypothetical protein
VDLVEVEEEVNKNGQIGRLTGVNSEESEVAFEVHLEANQSTAGVLQADLLDEGNDGVHRGQLDLPGLPTVPLLGDPSIDTFLVKGAVGDDPVTFAVLFRDSTKRGNSDREWQTRWVERTDETSVSELGLDVMTNVIDSLDGRRMVPSGTDRPRGADNPDVPAIDESIDDGSPVPIILKQSSPGCRLDEQVLDGNAEAILVGLTRSKDLIHKLDIMLDEDWATTEWKLTTRTWRRQ